MFQIIAESWTRNKLLVQSELTVSSEIKEQAKKTMKYDIYLTYIYQSWGSDECINCQ